ncbi:MAG: cbb3-type cytochrome c oxidase subunit I [Verrucomicrobia bacterium]|nr:cbb3-type cytochrome c oxidase subunit I [Verrucomicrobiota bacterium]
MSATSPSILQALSPSDTEDVAQRRALLAEIDASCRGTLMLFFGAALVWLLIGTVFALIASWKMHSPDFLADIPWLTFGRVRPAHLNAVVFGFASEAAIAVTLWLICRLCRAPLMHGWVVNIAGVFWNIGVAIGIGGILAGHSTAIEWLEIPGYATPLLFVSYALIAIWGIITFRFRREKHLYVSQWYLLAALFWFPWLYSAAQILLIMEPVRGVVQATVNWWFAHNVLGLWFTPIGIGAIYYFIPKVLGIPVYKYSLSVIGFWSLALFYNWNGMHHLVGGPLPAWLITVSIVASVMMTIPVVTVGLNHHFTMWGSFHKLKDSPVLRFMVFGGMSYTVTSLHGVLLALRSVSEVTHFTHSTIAHAHQGMYAFFTMVMFGAIYYIVPRIIQVEWPSARLISIHFWASAIGIMLYIVPLIIGGTLQGVAMINPDVPFLDPNKYSVVTMTVPYLRVRSVSGFIILVGHLAFATSFIWIVARWIKAARQHQPTPIVSNV